MYSEYFSKPGSILGGEPALPHIPGVEATTGSLGHGLSYGAGIALGKKLDNKNNKVYVVGNTNSGKSTLINKLIDNYSTIDNKKVTTSMYPSTTLDKVEINEINYKYVGSKTLASAVGMDKEFSKIIFKSTQTSSTTVSSSTPMPKSLLTSA